MAEEWPVETGRPSPLDQSGTVILHDRAAQRWLLFRSPHRIYQARSAVELPALLQEIEQATEGDGCYAAGFLAYEAAPGLDRV